MSDKTVVGVGGHDWEFNECWAEAARLSDQDVADWARDHVAALLSERDELRAEVERLNGVVERSKLAYKAWEQLAHEKEAEIGRLRAALSEITDLELEGDAALGDAIGIADEALNPPPASAPTSANQTEGAICLDG